MTSFIATHIGMIMMMLFMAVMFASGILIYIGIRNYYRLKDQHERLEEIVNDLRHRNDELEKQLADDLLQYLKTLTVEISVFEFRDFIDTHDVKLVTKENIKRLCEKVANEVFKALRQERLKNVTEWSLLTHDFYIAYVIHTSIMSIKRLLDKEIENAGREGE